MILNKKQLALGYIGLALLRNRLTSKSEDIKKSLSDIKRIISDEPTILKEHVNVKKYSLKSGYKAWSQSYDNMTNLLINAEQPVLEKLLTKFHNNTALDAACGTGRISKMLNKKNKVVGIDISLDMLQIAKDKVPSATFLHGSIEKIPLEDNKVDITVCSLALTHLKSIEKALKEFKRVTKPGGTILLTDIHPTFVLIGGQAEFYGNNGETGYVENNIHPVSMYFKMFQQSELIIRKCIEVPFNIKPSEVSKIGLDIDSTITAHAMSGIPLVLVWVLEKAK